VLRRARFKASVLVVAALGALTACRRGPTGRPAARADGAASAALGAHALLTHDQNKGIAPATTAPIDTRPAGSALLAVSMGRNPNFAVPTDTFHNRWTALGKRNPYADGNRFYTAMWSVVGASGGAGHTLSATKASDPVDEISLALIEVVGGSAVTDFAYAYPKLGSPNTPGSVKTGGPATLIAVWGGDANALTHTATPSDGFQVIDSYLRLGPTSGVQIAIATKQVTAADTYSVTWTATPAQGAACYLVAVE
jgi:hypothetical protein